MPVPRSLLPSPSTGLTLTRTLLLTVAPHGGQLVARRNAWAGMVDDAQRARSHREATAAMDLVLARADQADPAATSSG